MDHLNIFILLFVGGVANVHSICTTYSNCDMCMKPHKYGIACTFNCPDNCDSGCHRTDGHCDHQCKTGYFGRFCNDPCPGHCVEGCNQTSAVCFGGCMSGWYGMNCTEVCPPGCRGACDRKTGECLKPGHTDTVNTSPTRCVTTDCSMCQTGWYGPTCTNRCPVNCDGGCNSLGFCDYQCVTGYYGKTCIITCPPQCSSGCNQTTGYCFERCNPGWYGDRCTRPCPTDCVDKVCYRKSGVCTKGVHGTTATPNTATGQYYSGFLVSITGIYFCFQNIF